MKKPIKKPLVAQEEFEHTMTTVQQQFNRIDDHFKEIREKQGEHDARFDSHDARFDEHDRRFDEHDKRFDRIERVMNATLEIVQRIDQQMKEDRGHRLPERVDTLEDDVLKIKARLS